MRSQTRAAQALGISQPTVSTHIKRLHEILGVEVFDRSVPGVILTEIGETVLRQAQAVLELHDGIFATCSRSRPQHLVRIGIHNSVAESMLPPALKRCREKWPALRFDVTSNTSENLIAALQENEIDIILALTVGEPAFPPRHHWPIRLAWGCAKDFSLVQGAPIPLVAFSGNSQLTSVARGALDQAGLEFEILYSSSDQASLTRAVEDGLGIAALPREMLTRNIGICTSEALPPLPDLICGIYCGTVADGRIHEDVADAIAEQVAPAEAPLTGAAA